MARRVISDRQRAWLAGELDLWRGQGILSQDQATHIPDLYETRGQIAERKRSRAVLALMGIAAFLVGLAALLVIAYNWEGMGRSFKLAVIFGVVAGTHAGGLSLRSGRRSRLLSEIVLFLGCLFYGAGIWLMAQVFHISAHSPDARHPHPRRGDADGGRGGETRTPGRTGPAPGPSAPDAPSAVAPPGPGALHGFPVPVEHGHRPGGPMARRAALLPTVLANAAMIACALWLMRAGLREDRGRLFAAGVLYFLLWAVLRYIDLFGDFGGMLGAALMFFLCGGALFGVATSWRRRREARSG